VEAALAGNRSAFEVLIAQYKVPLLHSVRRLADSSTLADDIVAATFTRAYSKLERFDGTCTFFTWLYTIAENEMRVHWRSNSRAPLVELNENHPPHRDAPAMASGPDAELRQKAVRKLYKAISTLPEVFRVPLRMHYLHGLGLYEVARQLNIPYGTACSRVYRGTSLLRKVFEGYPKPVSL
jgi:RNA polymerase sigma-70 factor (ECF subfamily)